MLMQVGPQSPQVYRIPSRGAGNFELGFEVIPLNFDSDPNFDVLDGQLGDPLYSKQAVSLTSAHLEPRNPIHQQGQATFFELEPAPTTTTTTTTPKPVHYYYCDKIKISIKSKSFSVSVCHWSSLFGKAKVTTKKTAIRNWSSG